MPRAPAATDPFLARPGSALVLGLLADKWTIPVIHALARGTRRTGELRRGLAGVSQKVLTQTLRRLEAHGLVERTVHPEVPPRVEYALTALGRSLDEPLARICAWVERHGGALQRARGRAGGASPR
ncbi:MAG: helix-turn-helix domain-containing protein [Gemmatimonadales bacterium]|nr:helix-turn-helix domain-containing protein [Gemmatimonadales bacterium]